MQLSFVGLRSSGMCGIYGFAGFNEDGLLDRMGKVIVDRGPDGEGSCVAPNGAAFHMGTQRLSIIELQGGWQPIYNEDQSIAICYNGETYNYLELREQLEKKGHQFRDYSINKRRIGILKDIQLRASSWFIRSAEG